MADKMDSQLLQDYIGGNSLAFEELVELHQGMVLGVCRRVTGNSEDSEDAAQATFLLLASRAEKLQSHTSIAGWLHRTATNVARTTLRSTNRRKHWESRAMSEIEIGEQAAPEHKEFFLSILDQALMKLSDRDRECLVLHYIEELSPADVASQLDVNSSTLSMRLARARERLRKQLRKLGLPLTGTAVVILLANPLNASASTGFAMAVSTAAGQLQASGIGAITSVSPSVVSLSQGVLKTMFVKKLVMASVVMLMVVSAGYALTRGPSRSSANGDQPIVASPRAQENVVEPTAVVSPDTKKRLIEVGDWGFIELSHNKAAGKVTLKTLDPQKKPKGITGDPVLVVKTSAKDVKLKASSVNDVTFEITSDTLKGKLVGHIELPIGDRAIKVEL